MQDLTEQDGNKASGRVPAGKQNSREETGYEADGESRKRKMYKCVDAHVGDGVKSGDGAGGTG